MCLTVFLHEAFVIDLQQSEIYIFLCCAGLFAFCLFSAKRLWCDNVFMRRRGATSAKRPLQIMVRTVNHYAKHTPTSKQWQNNKNTNTNQRNTTSKQHKKLKGDTIRLQKVLIDQLRKFSTQIYKQW